MASNKMPDDPNRIIRQNLFQIVIMMMKLTFFPIDSTDLLTPL